MHVKLTKIKSSHQILRTETVVGDAAELPAVGKRFTMTSEPLDTGMDIRFIQTSAVTEVTATGFTTANSEYQLEVL